jgi:hypothetical protein
MGGSGESITALSGVEGIRLPVLSEVEIQVDEKWFYYVTSHTSLFIIVVSLPESFRDTAYHYSSTNVALKGRDIITVGATHRKEQKVCSPERAAYHNKVRSALHEDETMGFTH